MLPVHRETLPTPNWRSECPFCHSALTPVDVPGATAAGARYSRAALFAFGATLATGSALALSQCAAYGGAPAPLPNDAAMADAAVDAAADVPTDDGSPGVRYGAPPVDP